MPDEVAQRKTQKEDPDTSLEPRELEPSDATVAQQALPGRGGNEARPGLRLPDAEPELGIEDATAAVEPIYPLGHIAPATAAAARPGGPNASPAMNPGADTGEFSNQAQTRTIGDDSQNQYGGGYARGNPYGAVAQESRHDPAFQARGGSGSCSSTRCPTTASRTRWCS